MSTSSLATRVALFACSAAAACGVPAETTVPSRVSRVSSANVDRAAPVTDARIPAGLREQVDAYLEASGAVKGAHVTELTIDPEISAIALALGRERLGEGFARFRFGKAPPIELQGASAGKLEPFASLSKIVTAARGAGHGFELAPLTVAAGFAAVANDGVYRAPTLVRRVKDEAGGVIYESKPESQRILRHETTETMLRMLEAAVDRDDAHGKAARIPGCRVAGKTGTGEEGNDWLYGTFVGAFPSAKPRMVILTGVVARRGAGYSGASVAAPLFREVAKKIIAKRGC